MFEQQPIVAEREIETEVEVQALEHLLQPLSAAPVAPANAGFQLPRAIWTAMLACYATFFVAIALATGGSGPAKFAIIVSLLYTAMYFGLARIGARQAGPESQSPLERGGKLQTWTGPMAKEAVYGQVLIVPLAVALFGIGIFGYHSTCRSWRVTMRTDLSPTVAKYAESPLFDEQTVPDKLTSNHDLKPGVWGRICVHAGTLEFHIPGDPHNAHEIHTGEHAIIEPKQVHFVRLVGHVEFKVEFYR